MSGPDILAVDVGGSRVEALVSTGRPRCSRLVRGLDSRRAFLTF